MKDSARLSSHVQVRVAVIDVCAEGALHIQHLNSVLATTDGSSSPVEWNVDCTTGSAVRDVDTSERV